MPFTREQIGALRDVWAPFEGLDWDNLSIDELFDLYQQCQEVERVITAIAGPRRVVYQPPTEAECRALVDALHEHAEAFVRFAELPFNDLPLPESTP